MDKNGDGKISREEFPGPAQRFQAMDSDSDGFITAKEFASMLSRGPGGAGGQAGRSHPLADWYAKLPVILTHTHFNVGVGRGRDRSEDWSGALANANDLMARHNIRAAIVMPTPRPRGRGDEAEFDSLIRLARDRPGRFFASGGGGTLNGTINAIRAGSVDDGDKRAFARRAEEIVSAGGVGFGETTALHFSFWAGHPFEETQPDHPLFLLLADIAAKHNVPLDLHVEAVNRRWTVSQSLHDRGDGNPNYVDENLAALDRLLGHNPKAKIVWVHLGMDSTGHRTVELTRRLLRAHANLHLSITSFMISSGEDPLFTPGVGLNPKWRQLILEFPDRFMIGSDTFFQTPHAYKEHAQPLENGTRIVRFPFLPPDVARKVAYENAQRIFKLDVIKPGEYPPPGESGRQASHSPGAGAKSGDAGEEMVGPRGRTALQVIGNLDENGDGKIGRREFRGPQQRFATLDANGDSFITKEELEARWRKLKQRTQAH